MIHIEAANGASWMVNPVHIVAAVHDAKRERWYVHMTESLTVDVSDAEMQRVLDEEMPR